MRHWNANWKPCVNGLGFLTGRGITRCLVYKDLSICLRGPPTQYFLLFFSWFWVLPKRNPSVCWGRGGAVLWVPLINLVSSLWELSWRTDKGSVSHFYYADLYLISVSRAAQEPSLALRTFGFHPAFPECISHLSVGPEGVLRKWLLLKILKSSSWAQAACSPLSQGALPPTWEHFLVCCWAFPCQPTFSFLTDLFALPNTVSSFTFQFLTFCYCHLILCPASDQVRHFRLCWSGVFLFLFFSLLF